MKPKHNRDLRSLGAIAALSCMLAVASASGQGPTPKELIETTVDRALAVLRDPKLQAPDKREQRFARVRDVVNEVFDWEEMARRSLGVHWRSIDAQQRDRFVDVLKALLADRYMEDINRFRGEEQVKVEGMQRQGDSYRVDTVIVTRSRERVPISYFLHDDGDSYRVHDFSVEGISLVNHYRKSFGRFLVNHSFEELLKKLASKR